MRAVVGALWCALCAILPACTNLKSPQITLDSASTGERTVEAMTVNLSLRLQNPNNEALELLDLVYDVKVDGRHAFSGKRSAQMTLARLSTRELTLPAVLVFDDLGWGGEQLPAEAHIHLSGSLRYLQPGALAQTLFDTGVRKPRKSFQDELRITLAGTSGP